jgi:NodT family efflux transporter outer membrane factor (OMF) lipoprotein
MRKFVFIGAVLFTAACNVGPKYVKPATPIAPAFKESAPESFKETAGWKIGEPKDDLHKGKWWEIFGDPQLNALEERINPANQTLAAAEAQLRGARAAIRVSRAALFPTVNGGASVVGSMPSQNRIAGRSVTLGAAADIQVPFTASWEADLFWRIRNTIAANTASAQATAADLENLRLILHSEMALNYFQLRGLEAQKEILDRNVDAFQKAVDLTINRYNQGVVSQVDVTQAQTQLEQTRAQATDTEVQRQQLEHAIAILMGVPPSEFTLARAPFDLGTPPPIPGVLPSELLERRPDIAANERRVAAANAQIGVAKAAFYPTLNFAASAGFESSSLVNLFSWPSRFWSVGPTLAQTLFEGGRRRGVTEEAQASYDITVANYRQNVLTAFQNVEDNLAELRILDQEAREQAAAVGFAQRTAQIANNRYQGGITTYLEVITAQAAALINERTAVAIRTRRMAASVALVQALGGGWDVSQLPSAQDVTPKRAGR